MILYQSFLLRKFHSQHLLNISVLIIFSSPCSMAGYTDEEDFQLQHI